MNPCAIVWAAWVCSGGTASEPIAEVAPPHPISTHARCYTPELTEEQWQAILDLNGALPPVHVPAEDERFITQSSVWRGEALIDSAGQARSTRLTYSFAADGASWGISGFSDTGSNNLNARFSAHFGAASLDRGREHLRQTLASWRRYSGIVYDEVADNNSAMDGVTSRSALRGDIRFGGFGMGQTGLLAFNFYPAFGGDVVFNTDYFISSAFNRPDDSYRYIRNTMAHEHGHGLGCFHTVPCDFVKLMQPFITVVFDMVQIDERRASGSSYGDRFSGNQTAATARSFGNLTSPSLRSVIERDLSTNGVAGPGNSDEDWFSFTTSSTQPVVISVAPTGGTYVAGAQFAGCDGDTPTINASSAGNLNIQLIASNGTTVLQTGAVSPAGSIETLNAGMLGASTFYVRVYDVGPNPIANQTVQLYDLTIRIGSSTAPPLAIAGVNKRIAANTSCFFMGDLNSAANEGTLPGPASFDWDLDGDNAFETIDAMQVNRQYPSNGLYPVRLRVTDSNNQSTTDTINVTVFGATTTVGSCVPSAGQTGATVPVVITGTNLKNVTSASMVTVSGSGVSVTGTPVPNALGTSLSGLSFVVSAAAATGNRSVTVSNSDGSGTGTSVFSVSSTPPALPGSFSLGMPAHGTYLAGNTPVLSWSTSTGALSYNVKIDNDPTFVSPEYSVNTGFASVVVPAGLLAHKSFYYWRVTATNLSGSTMSTPSASLFRTGICGGDANYDLAVNFSDITNLLENWDSTCQ